MNPGAFRKKMDSEIEDSVTSTTRGHLIANSFLMVNVTSEFIPGAKDEINSVSNAEHFCKSGQSETREVTTEQTDFQASVSKYSNHYPDDDHFVACGIIKKEENLEDEQEIVEVSDSDSVVSIENQAELEPEDNEDDDDADDNFRSGFNSKRSQTRASTSQSENFPNSQWVENDSDICIVYQKDGSCENTPSNQRLVSNNNSSIFKQNLSNQASSHSSHLTGTKQPDSKGNTLRQSNKQFVYRRASELKQHLKSHSGEQNVDMAEASWHSDIDNNVGPFKCPQCSEAFKSKSTLKIHSVSHSNHGPLSCSVCFANFPSKLNLKQHLMIHLNEWPFSCTDCGAMFKVKWHLKQHSLVHSEKPFACSLCDATFKSKPGLRAHLTTHVGEKKFSCIQCPSVFKSKLELQLHAAKHSDNKFKCADCDATFETETMLSEHVTVHSGEKPLACTESPETFKIKGNADSGPTQNSSEFETHIDRSFSCNKCTATFLSEKALKTHLRRVHFVCPQCNGVFKNKYVLQRHFAVHSTDRPHSCTYCDATFKQKSTLAEHLVIHSKKKPFKCPKCTTRFKSKLRLKSHLNAHLDEMPYKCTFCGAKFKSKLGFKLHAAVHLNEKLFSCQQCSALLKLDALLDEQLMVCSSSKSISCQHCSAKFKSELAFRLHSAVHLKAELCESCAFCI